MDERGAERARVRRHRPALVDQDPVVVDDHEAGRFLAADVADHLGISITAICHWEQDRSRPKSARLNALSEFFGVSSAELLGEQGAPGRHRLADLVARARAEIARAAGTNPSKVRITIEI